MVSNYPVQFDVDFPGRPLHRLTTAFRLLAAIPIVIVITMLTGEKFRADDTTNTIVIGGAAVFLPLVLMLVFRQKYPRWCNRVNGYAFTRVTDQCPPFRLS